MSPTGRATAYAYPNGVLILPDGVRDLLGVRDGGGVMFVPTAEHVVEMMSDAAWLRRVGEEPLMAGDPRLP